MPKLRKYISLFLALWLCVMLIAFTYTWVSRNWTPSIKLDDLNIESAGSLVISIQGDDVTSSVSLNEIIGLNSFTFRQVSSQDGATFLRKDFTDTLKGLPAKFYKINEGETYTGDYIETEFFLELDDSLETAKYIFIHPETYISYDKNTTTGADVNEAIRISLSYERKLITESGTKVVTGGPFILADVEDDREVYSELYKAVAPDANGKTDDDPTALGYQTVYGLHYFDYGRNYYEGDDYAFSKDEDRVLFRIEPGETVTVTMRIWLEGEDENCVNEIAGKKFGMFLKFDSMFVPEGE